MFKFTGQLGRFSTFGIYVGLFLAILGAKLILVDRFGTDVPFFDQWPAEGEIIFQPYFNGTLRLADFFAQHNEHRIFFTRALALGLLIFGGQWDARVQCIVNACIHSALLTAFYAFWHKRLAQSLRIALLILISLLTCLPLVWENTLCGFQSQFYLLIGFSLSAIWLLLNASPFSARWTLGVLSGLSAVVTMGSGFLCALPIALLLGVRMLKDKISCKRLIPSIAAAISIRGVGLLLRTAVPWHEPLHAKTISDFYNYFAHCLSWPLATERWPAFLFSLPWLTLAAGFFATFRRSSWNTDVEFVISGGIWVLLQTAAVTYARGAGSGFPANRYGDIFIVGLLFNFLAICLLFNQWRSLLRIPIISFGLLWSLVLIWACLHTNKDFRDNTLPAYKHDRLLYEQNVQAYMLTVDFSHL